MVQGRPKGVKAERDVARLLTEWWRALEPPAEFIRTPLSGGWSTPKLRGTFRASGDIMTTSQTFPFTVEVKRREAFTWRLLLGGFRSPVWGWWGQTVKAADEQGGVPLLWLRRSDEPWRVMLPLELANMLLEERLLASRFLVAPALDARTPLQGFTSDKVTILTARALLAVPPESLLRLLGASPE